jgi:hypothetical protein
MTTVWVLVLIAALPLGPGSLIFTPGLTGATGRRGPGQ